MKKIVLFTFVFAILAGMSLVSFIPIESSAPLEDYTVYVSWNSSQCNTCGPIVEKTLYIEVWDIYADPDILIDEDEIDITSESSPYQYDESGNIFWNCEDCYEVKIKIEYYDSEGLCCDCATSDTYDGEVLISGANIGCYPN